MTRMAASRKPPAATAWRSASPARSVSPQAKAAPPPSPSQSTKELKIQKAKVKRKRRVPSLLHFCLLNFYLFQPDEAEHYEERAFESGFTTAWIEPFVKGV